MTIGHLNMKQPIYSSINKSELLRNEFNQKNSPLPNKKKNLLREIKQIEIHILYSWIARKYFENTLSFQIDL